MRLSSGGEGFPQRDPSPGAATGRHAGHKASVACRPLTGIPRKIKMKLLGNVIFHAYTLSLNKDISGI